MARAVETTDRRMCPVCNALLNSDSEVCPVCALKSALESENHATATELRFEHYQILKNEGQGLMELGRGAMGITYKALDVDLRCPVTLKVISERYLGDESAQLRFLREARAAAKVRHSNVASVLHLAEPGAVTSTRWSSWRERLLNNSSDARDGSK